VNSRLQFDYYFRVAEQIGEEGTDDLGDTKKYCVCSGEAVTIGESVLLTGVYFNQATGNIRARSLILQREELNPKNRFRHGIMLSAAPATHDFKHSPVAGIVLFERVDNEKGPVEGRPTSEEIANAVDWLTSTELKNSSEAGNITQSLIQNKIEPTSSQADCPKNVLWINAQLADAALRPAIAKAQNTAIKP